MRPDDGTAKWKEDQIRERWFGQKQSVNYSVGTLIVVRYARHGRQIAEIVRVGGLTFDRKQIYQIRKWRANSRTWVGNKSHIFITEAEIIDIPDDKELKRAGWTSAQLANPDLDAIRRSIQ